MIEHFDLLNAEIHKHLGLLPEDIGTNSGHLLNKFLKGYPNWSPGAAWCVATAMQLWHNATPLSNPYKRLYGQVGTTAMRELWVANGGKYERGAVAKGAVGTLWKSGDDIHTFICMGEDHDPRYILTADGNWGNGFNLTRHLKSETGLLLP